MAGAFWLSDRAWSAIEPLLPSNQPGARRVDDRRIISSRPTEPVGQALRIAVVQCSKIVIRLNLTLW